MKVKRKFRFYPTEAQKVSFAQTFGCVRFVYNKGLEYRKTEFENGGKPNFRSSSVWLTGLKKEKEFSFLNEVSSVPLQQSLRHLNTGYVNFFRKTAKFPKFKSRGNRQSCTFARQAFNYRNGKLSLAKIGDLDVRWSMPLENEPTTVTAIRDPDGSYYVTLTIEEADKTLPRVGGNVGIDLGIKTFATLSDGRKFDLPKGIKGARKKLSKLQKRHSRKQKGSKRRNKARLRVARAHKRVADIRQDFLHKLSTSIVRENQTVAVEDLAVANMVKNRKLSRAIGEQGWRAFREMLRYKCEWYGREFKVADRWFASSKTCSVCGEKTDLTLKDRDWVCRCGASHDRDVNAAANILAAGQAVAARGGTVRPEKLYVFRAGPVKREPLTA